MPLCAVVSNRLLCMHGGISPEIQNWDSLVTLQVSLKFSNHSYPFFFS
ncbi:unnamed protein product [Haemonchus placei]|uniref:SER_THR_PHOSPHATASE domain-containing protein n=1 Tax=Haemonchus placei TaxID=6290 RepID=A0A0N4XB98_HAEPC|nr:unnamed protein product [Haemonchus placei]